MSLILFIIGVSLIFDDRLLRGAICIIIAFSL